MSVTTVRKFDDDELRPPQKQGPGADAIEPPDPLNDDELDDDGVEAATVDSWEQGGGAQGQQGDFGDGPNLDELDEGIGGFVPGTQMDQKRLRVAQEAADDFANRLGAAPMAPFQQRMGAPGAGRRSRPADSVSEEILNTRAQSEGRWAAMRERFSSGQHMVDEAAFAAGEEVFPRGLQNRLSQSIHEPYPHGLNAAYTLLYFTGGERERQAALAGLEQEVKSGHNQSALRVLQELSLVDAVRDLKAARSEDEVQSALKKLAGLEIGSDGKEATKILEKFPSAQEARTEREQQMTPEEIQKSRAEKLQQARFSAREVSVSRTLQTSDDVVAAATGSSKDRREALGRLEAEADFELRSGTYGPAKIAYDKLSALGAAADVFEAGSPRAAADALSTLVQKAAANNDTAKNVLGGLDTRNLLSRLRNADGTVSAQALEELKATLKPHAQLLEGMKNKSAKDILEEFQDKEAVAKARKSMRDFADESFKRADTSLGVLLDRQSTPEQRQAALKQIEAESQSQLRALRSNSYDSVIQTARSAVSVEDVRTAAKSAHKTLQDANASPQDKAKAIDLLQTQLQYLEDEAHGSEERAANPKALQYLSEVGDRKAIEKLQQDLTGNDAVALKAIEELFLKLPSANDALNELRLGRILRSVTESSTPADFDKVIEALAKEAEVKGRESNPQAAEWLKWAEAGKQTARITHATDAKEIKDTARALTDLAKNKNPYAESALAGVLAMDGDSRGIMEIYRSSERTVNNKPSFLPKMSDLLKQNEAARQTLQESKLEIANYIAQRVAAGGKLERGDAAALALAFAHERDGGKDTALSDSLKKTLSQAVDSKDGASAMKGIADVISVNAPASRDLADIYMRGNGKWEFVEQFNDMEVLARGGNEGALRILAATTSGIVKDGRLQDWAIRSLEGNHHAPELRQRTLDALVHANGVYGDKNHLLETMGKVASSFTKPEDVPQNVRTALQDGIASKTESTHASAARGMMKMSALWTQNEVDSVYDHSSKHTAAALRAYADKIPANLRAQLISDLSARANPLIPEEPSVKAATLQSLAALSQHMTARQISNVAAYGGDGGLKRMQATGLNNADALKLQQEAGRVLLSAIVTGPKELKREAFAAFEKSRFEGVTREMRDVFTKMANDQPFDLELYEKVNKLVYDTGLPRPVAGILKNWNVPVDSNDELFQNASQATKYLEGKVPGMSGDAMMRRIADNIEVFNSMPPEYRAKLFAGKENDPEIKELIKSPVNAQVVVRQMLNGLLHDSPNAFLLRDLRGETSRMAGIAAGESYDAKKKLDAKVAEQQGRFDELIAHTKGGVSLLEKVGYVATLTTPIASITPYDPFSRFEDKQGNLLRDYRSLDPAITALSKDYQNVEALKKVLGFASDIGTYSTLKNSGRQKEADRMLVGDLLRYNQQYLQTLAPNVFADLIPKDDTQLGRSALGRLKDSGQAVFSQLPQLDFGTQQALGQGLKALSALPKDGYQIDVPAVRALAMASIESSPGIAKVGDVSRAMGDKLTTLNKLVQAASSGRKYDDLVQDAQQQARDLKKIFAEFKPEDREQLTRSILAIGDALERQGPGKIEDQGARAELTAKLANLKQMKDLLDPRSSSRQQVDQLLDHVTSPNFKADTFVNFLKTQGPLIAATVVAAAATVAACVTLGVSSPLAIAAWCSVAGIAASEVTTYGLYKLNENGYTGYGVYGQKAKFQKWYDSTKPEDRTVANFAKVVRVQYAEQFLFDTSMAMLTMGLVKFVPAPSQLFQKAAYISLLKGEGQSMAQMAFNAQKAALIAEGKSAAGAYTREMLKNMGKEVMINSGFTTAQLAAEEVVKDMTPEQWKKTLEEGNGTVSFTLGTGLAMMHAGIAARVGGGRVTHFDAPTLKAETAFVNHYLKQGFRVQPVHDGMYNVWPPNARASSAPFVLQRGTGVPPARVFPDGYKPAAHPGEPNLNTKVTGADGHTWQQTASEGKLLREMNTFSEHFRAGRFEEALRVSEGAQSGAQSKKTRPVEATAESLADPKNLSKFLSDMGDVASVNRGTASDGKKVSVELPAPVIEIAPGVKVDFRTGKNVKGEALSAEHQKLYDAFRRGEGGERIMAEMALINMEEAIHVNQYGADGHIMSPSFAKFASQAPDGTAVAAAFRGQFKNEFASTGGRAKFTYEQEAILALHDSNPNFWTAEMLDRHFGGQHKEIRKPVIEWLRAQEKQAGDGAHPARPRVPGGPESLPERAGPAENSQLGRNPQFEKVIKQIEVHETTNFVGNIPTDKRKTADYAQQNIYSQIGEFLKAPAGPGKPSLADQGWSIHQSQKNSPADHAKMDYLLINENTGQYFVLDSTAQTKNLSSDIRRNSIIKWEEPLHVDSADGRLTKAGKDMVDARLKEIMETKSPLNLADHPPPSFKTAADATEAKAAIEAYRAKLKGSSHPDIAKFNNELQGTDYHLGKEVDMSGADAQKALGSFQQRADKALEKTIRDFLEATKPTGGKKTNEDRNFSVQKGELTLETEGQRFKWTRSENQISSAVDKVFREVLAKTPKEKHGDLYRLRQSIPGGDELIRRTGDRLQQQSNDQLFGREVIINKFEAKAISSLKELNNDFGIKPADERTHSADVEQLLEMNVERLKSLHEKEGISKKPYEEAQKLYDEYKQRKPEAIAKANKLFLESAPEGSSRLGRNPDDASDASAGRAPKPPSKISKFLLDLKERYESDPKFKKNNDDLGYHDLDDYAGVLNDMKVEPVEFLGAGFESVAIKLSDGNVLKITRTNELHNGVFREDWGHRSFDAKVIGKVEIITTPKGEIAVYKQPPVELGNIDVTSREFKKFKQKVKEEGEVIWDKDYIGDQVGFLLDPKTGDYITKPVIDKATGKRKTYDDGSEMRQPVVVLIDYPAVAYPGDHP